MARPLLGDVELQHVQQIEIDGDQVLVEHGVPALEGDFLQGLGRRGMQVTLTGVLTGPEVGQGLKALRDKFRAAAPVSFVADITTATQVDQVLIEEMGVRELAGKPERFEYAFTLREYTPAPEPERRVPPSPPPPPAPLTSTLVVTVIVEGEPDFDHDETRVTVEGTQQEDGAHLQRTLTNRQENVWTEEDFPPGTYTVTATPADPGLRSGSKSVELPQGKTAEVEIRLSRGKNNVAKAFIIHFWFDKAFIEPCMRAVMRQVAQYAGSHPDEKLVIVGHTDESGSSAYNQALSERRGRSAYAYLTHKLDPQGSVAEWNELRKERTPGDQRTVRDTWSTREYQHMLQDLGHYPGNVNGNDDERTDKAVRAFQAKHGLTVDGSVGDETWPVLINEYMAQDDLAVAKERFLANGQEVLKWLGCGETMPLPSTPGRQPAPDPNEPPPPPEKPEPPKPSCGDPAWRPNRRTELLFVKDDALPCKVPEPVTFRLPPGKPAGNQWNLGPGSAERPCCFITRDANETDRWLVQPAEPGEVLVKGSIKFEDGRPLANAKYLLIAPDGEFMNGEQVCRPRDASKPGKGHGIPGRTDADGDFTDAKGNKHYLLQPKGVGVYALELQGPYVARLKGAPATDAKGNVVCKRLDAKDAEFHVIVQPLPASLEFVDARDIERELDRVRWGQDFVIRADIPGITEDEITIEITSYLIRR